MVENQCHPYIPSTTVLGDKNNIYNALLEQAPNDQVKASLMAVARTESGAWLSALPIASLGLRMSDDVVRIAVGLRLGVPLCQPHFCTCCGADVNIF